MQGHFIESGVLSSLSDLVFSIQLSIVVASISTLIVAMLGTALGYILARFNFPGKSALDALLSLPLILPPTVVGFYLLGVFGKQGAIGHWLFDLTGWTPIFTWQAAVIAAVIISLPLMVRTSKAAFESVDLNLESVSLTLGKSKLDTLLQVTFPLAMRGLLAGIALSFARALGEFGATLMIAGNIPGKTQTIPLLIYQATQTGENQLVLNLVIFLSLFSFIVALISNQWRAKW